MAVSIEEIVKTAEEMRISLTDWQIQLIQDRNIKRWCLNCGRKTGKTTAIEFRTAMRLINDDVKGNALSGGICIVSKGLDQAKQILSGIKLILTALGFEFSKERSDMKDGFVYTTTQEIKMPNGNRVFAKACGINADSLRPYSFHEFIFDEADLLAEAVFVSTEACLAKFDGTQILESTPNPLGDRTTYFARAFFGEMPDYKVLHIPTSSAFHVSKDWLARQHSILSSAEYEREYEAKFSSGSNSIFPESMIDACTKQFWEPGQADAVFLGVNFARYGTDRSVIAENWFAGGICKIRIKILQSQESRIMHVEEALKAMARENKLIDKIIVDDRNLGTGPMQALVEEFGTATVIGVTNHQIIKDIEGGRSRYQKEDLFTNLLRFMERQKVDYFDPDGEIKRSLMDIKYDYYKKSGMVRIFGSNMADAVAEAVVRAVFPVWGRQNWYGDVKGAIAILK